MHKLRGRFWMALVIGALAVPAPAAAEDKEVCTTDKDGKKDCFVFRCLPSENHTLSTVVVEDVDLCIAPHKFTRDLSARKDAIEALTKGCTNAGGVLRDGGSRVTCTPGPAAVGQAGPSAGIEGGRPVTVHVTKSVSAEIDAFMATHSFSRETSAVLVQLVHQGGVPFNGFKQSGGWCWNDDGTFYGSVPCPKQVKRSVRGMDKR